MVCSTFSRSWWSAVRNASLAKGGASNKRPSPHFHKVTIRSNEVSPWNFQTASYFHGVSKKFHGKIQPVSVRSFRTPDLTITMQNCCPLQVTVICCRMSVSFTADIRCSDLSLCLYAHALSGAHKPPIQWILNALTSGIKRPECEVCQSCVRGANAQIFNSDFHIRLLTAGLRRMDNFIFLCN
jgi:hypothetical protein